MIGFSTSGVNIGNIAALLLGSYLCVNGFDGGWSSIFYIFGASGVAWFILFMLLTSESPQTHTCIGAREKKYIIDRTKGGSSLSQTRVRNLYHALYFDIRAFRKVSFQLLAKVLRHTLEEDLQVEAMHCHIHQPLLLELEQLLVSHSAPKLHERHPAVRHKIEWSRVIHSLRD